MLRYKKTRSKKEKQTKRGTKKYQSKIPKKSGGNKLRRKTWYLKKTRKKRGTFLLVLAMHLCKLKWCKDTLHPCRELKFLFKETHPLVYFKVLHSFFSCPRLRLKKVNLLLPFSSPKVEFLNPPCRSERWW